VGKVDYIAEQRTRQLLKEGVQGNDNNLESERRRNAKMKRWRAVAHQHNPPGR
jgi:hypothetical protein